jgi:hypothetical protein
MYVARRQPLSHIVIHIGPALASEGKGKQIVVGKWLLPKDRNRNWRPIQLPSCAHSFRLLPTAPGHICAPGRIHGCSKSDSREVIRRILQFPCPLEQKRRVEGGPRAQCCPLFIGRQFKLISASERRKTPVFPSSLNYQDQRDSVRMVEKTRNRFNSRPFKFRKRIKSILFITCMSTERSEAPPCRA